MKYIFWLKVAVLHGLAAWSGLAAYLYFYHHVSFFWFRIGNIILALFFTMLVTLVYEKFFHHLSTLIYGVVVVATCIVADLVLALVLPDVFPSFFERTGFVVSLPAYHEYLIVYAAIAIAIALTHTFYNRKRS